MKKAKKIIGLIFAYEPLCYYFGLIPEQYWNNTIKQNMIYVQSNLAKKLDDAREKIQLAEITTDKLIKADALSTKNPKVLRIVDSYDSLFNEDKKQQTPEDIANTFLAIEKSEKGMWDS